MNNGRFIVFLIFIGLCIAFVVGIGACTDRWVCYSKYSSEFETKWSIPEGCMIKVGSKWIPDDRYREFDN